MGFFIATCDLTLTYEIRSKPKAIHSKKDLTPQAGAVLCFMFYFDLSRPLIGFKKEKDKCFRSSMKFCICIWISRRMTKDWGHENMRPLNQAWWPKTSKRPCSCSDLGLDIFKYVLLISFFIIILLILFGPKLCNNIIWKKIIMVLKYTIFLNHYLNRFLT